MEPLNYSTETGGRRRLPRWFKISGGVLILLVLLSIVAIAGVALLLWFCVWLMGKIAPML